MKPPVIDGQEVFVVMTLKGEKPLYFIDRSSVVSTIPEYGIVRDNGGTPQTARFEDVFATHGEAASAAASRLRLYLAEISMKYEETIAKLESLA